MLPRKNKSAFGCISTKDNNWKKENHMPSGDTSNGDNADVLSTGDSGGRDDADGNANRSDSAINEYSQAASVHGLKYVCGGNRSLFSRILWTLFFVGMLIGLSVTLFRHVNEMRSYPTLTKQTVVMEEELLFPAVTICNHNQFRRSVVENNTLLQQLLAQMSGFSYIFEPINFTGPVWIEANKESSPEEVAKLLEHAPHPLNKTLVRCHWRNEEYKCVDMFKTVMTDFGVCYAFNTRVTETEQRKSDLFGNMYGLSVIMNTNQPEYVLSQWNAASGFRVLLHGFWQTPQMIEKGFSVGPGSSYFGKISAQKISFLPAPFKAFGDKECIESNEGQMDGYLRYFQTYDHGACALECQMNFTYEACGCRGLYDPEYPFIIRPRVTS